MVADKEGAGEWVGAAVLAFGAAVMIGGLGIVTVAGNRRPLVEAEAVRMAAAYVWTTGCPRANYRQHIPRACRRAEYRIYGPSKLGLRLDRGRRRPYWYRIGDAAAVLDCPWLSRNAACMIAKLVPGKFVRPPPPPRDRARRGSSSPLRS